jgi:glycosidase
MPARKHPLLFQLNTRVYLTERGRRLGRPATLDDVPDAELDLLRDQGFDWLWLLGAWQTGRIGREVSRTNPTLRADYARALPDFRDEDIVGSPFAVQSYDVNREYGGDAALLRLRSRMAQRGLRLMLDFVVNHVAPDHPMVAKHPERFIAGDEQRLRDEPHNWGRFPVGSGTRILAYGRDPYFAGWPDTVQLDYRRAAVRAAMTDELERIAERCDGVRCDMAMLVEPDVFERTWGPLPEGSEQYTDDKSFWPAAVRRVRRRFPGFLFAAEVYWDMEFRLQQHGFDYTYDKSFYDRLVSGQGASVRGHLLAADDYQNHSMRFLENHDEPRAAGTFPWEMHRAAAVACFFVPGLRFFHEGQLSGRKVHVPMHLARRPDEPQNPEVQAFYARLLGCLRENVVHDGTFRLSEPQPAWDGNPTADNFIAFTWYQGGNEILLGVINYGNTQGQCYVPFACPVQGSVTLHDRLGDACYQRSGAELSTHGLYLDMPAWGYHLFAIEPG